jgi:branched-chain amino acid transport system permease protein
MKKVRTFGVLALLIFSLVFPLLFPNAAITSVAIFTLLFVVAATGWNIFSGYTGYMNLGYSAYFGVGAYTLGILCNNKNLQEGYTPFLLLPLCGLVASVFAVPLGGIALRVRQHTFVVITIAILFILQLLAYNLPAITGGSQGLFPPLPPWGPDFFNTPFYYVSLLLVLLAIFVSWWIRQSKYGLGLLAIRDDEDRAQGIGVKTALYKLTAYMISAFFAGMVGAMIVYFEGAIYPPVAFNPAFDVAVALMAFLGGAGTLVGPVLGALVMEPLRQYLSLQFSMVVGLDLILNGTLLLAVILLLPEGIVPTLRLFWRKHVASRKDISQTPGATEHAESLLLERRVTGRARD